MSSCIIISGDFNALKDELIAKYGINSLRFFETDELLVDDARAIISEAYIAEVSQKFIVVLAGAYSSAAQNALLKIIEEPPKNIVFILAASAKSLFLPTIRSRLPVLTKDSANTQRYELDLNLQTLTLKSMLEFLDKIEAGERVGEIAKNDLKAVISAIIDEAIRIGMRFSLDEYEYFYKLISLADLNAKSHALLTPLLLLILHKGRR
ncbi:DNA polymerase III subunit delta' [Campylobacter sp. 19-13652]|uniref:DNA polymerase III subunit delta' n=1 Tax=Campylobacter sp. 19-13652 TaxID=2840180 RepID=UPI001C74A8EA|nr:DNA polymerase III subunit delta' [Campylobacter sp. 19-13652]BCX79662.1 DNA polymerase III subunit delta' [Campylobacter sp. 19-13652]